jgi:hypothetical protein
METVPIRYIVASPGRITIIIIMMDDRWRPLWLRCGAAEWRLALPHHREAKKFLPIED